MIIKIAERDGTAAPSSIVDVLTGTKRAIIYDKTKSIFSYTRPFAINYTDKSGSPIIMMDGFKARGFVGKDCTYIINSVSDKEIVMVQRVLNLFWDADKFHIDSYYYNEGSVEDVIKEFKEREYTFKKITF